MSKHTKTQWTNNLTPMIKGGDKSIKINGHPLSVDYRILSEENFQFAKHRVNLHDELVDALGLALEEINCSADENGILFGDDKNVIEKIELVIKKAGGEV